MNRFVLALEYCKFFGQYVNVIRVKDVGNENNQLNLHVQNSCVRRKCVTSCLLGIAVSSCFFS